MNTQNDDFTTLEFQDFLSVPKKYSQPPYYYFQYKKNTLRPYHRISILYAYNGLTIRLIPSRIQFPNPRTCIDHVRKIRSPGNRPETPIIEPSLLALAALTPIDMAQKKSRQPRQSGAKNARYTLPTNAFGPNDGLGSGRCSPCTYRLMRVSTNKGLSFGVTTGCAVHACSYASSPPPWQDPLGARTW
ncbi:hypothetical protein P280DRAFT_36206 [Massarina eburnea CBS 473.64]|uniref:Uncharacterized protein n=1 Tax=Massarina eburnea CBS 473.64 TaxID=1395130 RepID=A0A6A6RY08_9PLEO|nr:hypothetical protein P280DRAFT_36206 [Massarina eburnea CBS 473.64]